MGLNSAMKILLLSVLLGTISVNAQFIYPDVKIHDPVQELEAGDDYINRMTGSKKIMQIDKIYRSSPETTTDIIKFDREGNITFSSKTVTLDKDYKASFGPGSGYIPENREIIYKTVLQDGKTVYFGYESPGIPFEKNRITYDRENKIYRITEKDKESEYFYKDGKLEKIVSTGILWNGGKYEVTSVFTYNNAGKVIACISKTVIPNGPVQENIKTLTYDASGNITSNQHKTRDGILEKKYIYTNNLLTHYEYMGSLKFEDRSYEYDAEKRLKKTVITKYEEGKMINKLTVSYLYKNNLLSEKVSEYSENNYQSTDHKVYTYDSRNRLVKIQTQSPASVYTDSDIAYEKNTIKLKSGSQESVYTLYE